MKKTNKKIFFLFVTSKENNFLYKPGLNFVLLPFPQYIKIFNERNGQLKFFTKILTSFVKLLKTFMHSLKKVRFVFKITLFPGPKIYSGIFYFTFIKSDVCEMSQTLVATHATLLQYKVYLCPTFLLPRSDSF